MQRIYKNSNATHIRAIMLIVSLLAITLPAFAHAAQDHASIDLAQVDDTNDIMLVHVRVSIATEDTTINAVELMLAYDSDALKIDHIDAATSDFEMAVPTEKSRGVIDIVRGDTKGLSHGTFQFVDIYFARTNPRRAFINLLPASQVTARDGQGTNVFDGRLPKLLL